MLKKYMYVGIYVRAYIPIVAVVLVSLIMLQTVKNVSLLSKVFTND